MANILSFGGSRALVFAGVLILAGCDSQSGTAAAPGEAVNANTETTTGTDWTKTVEVTPEGGYRMGNPDARVHLVEFASFTCSHCRDFHLEAGETIRNRVQSGQISYEYRPFVLNIQDLAAVSMATCEGPERFFTWANELYRGHDSWILPFTRLTEADVAPLQALPPEQQLKGLADVGGMHDFARTRGLPRAKFDQCLTDQAKIDTLTAQQQKAIETYKVQGTPTFLINGKKVDGASSWSTLEPKLMEALR